MELSKKFNAMFKKYVPEYGKAEILAGELLRAAAQIHYRYYNDGDVIGYGYGRETCNPPARFLLKNGDEDIKRDTKALWEASHFTAPFDIVYEAFLNELIKDVTKYVQDNPRLLITKTDSMFDYTRPEDVEDYEGEDPLTEFCEEFYSL